MVPSENLRKELELYYELPLSTYAWDDEFKNKIFSIKLNSYVEDDFITLGEIYEKGLNIGHCGATSRYFSIEFPRSKMHYGICDILVGTKNAKTGGHAWVEMDGYLLDPSLMILLPIELKELFGYHTARVLDKESSMILSEYDTYSNENHNLKKDPSGYVGSLYTFGNSDQR